MFNIKNVLLVAIYYMYLSEICIEAVQFNFKNNQGGDVWVGIQGASGKPHLNNGGFILSKGQSKSVDAPGDWSGRFWGRSYCDSNGCATGDCGHKVECGGNGGAPPATLAEITLHGDKGLDFYDISLVDGFNLPLSIEPINGQGDGSQYSCKKAACSFPLDACPGELQVKRGDKVIACQSACAHFHTDEYCCSGSHSKPENCKSSDWPKNYPKIFKDKCPDAYSYAYDDHKSTFTCKANAYNIVFE